MRMLTAHEVQHVSAGISSVSLISSCGLLGTVMGGVAYATHAAGPAAGSVDLIFNILFIGFNMGIGGACGLSIGLMVGVTLATASTLCLDD